MHIALLAASLSGGGVEKTAHQLVLGFLSNYHTVDLITLDDTGTHLFQETSSLRIIRLKKRRIRSACASLFLYFCANEPDIFLSHQDYVNIIAFISHKLSRSKSLFVPVVHAQVGFFTGFQPSFKSVILTQLLKFVYSLSSHVVTVSSGLRDELITILSLDPSQVSAIYNPIITDTLFSSSNKQLALNLSLPNNVPLILSAGRLVPSKDFPTLLRAFRRVLDALPAHLLILGSGPEKANLIHIAQIYGLVDSVTFIDYQPNPYPIFASSEVFVLCSTSEGFGNVLVEALALGCATISTN